MECFGRGQRSGLSVKRPGLSLPLLDLGFEDKSRELQWELFGNTSEQLTLELLTLHANPAGLMISEISDIISYTCGGFRESPIRESL